MHYEVMTNPSSSGRSGRYAKHSKEKLEELLSCAPSSRDKAEIVDAIKRRTFEEIDAAIQRDKNIPKTKNKQTLNQKPSPLQQKPGLVRATIRAIYRTIIFIFRFILIVLALWIGVSIYRYSIVHGVQP
jgi:hypothetical protein